MSTRAPGVARRIGMVLGRSFFPFAALAIIVGTVVWGPWVSLGLTLAFWFVVDRLECR